MQLTPHFSLQELTVSDWAARHGVSNQPNSIEIENLKRTAVMMEAVRTVLGDRPIFVHSAYRSAAVNVAVGGVETSAHCRGLACDFVCVGLDNLTAARMIVASNLVFSQLILEYGWIHIGLPDVGQTAKCQLMTKRSATSHYENGINA